MMATVITPAVRRWLEGSQVGRVLHLFERVCSLVNERGEVLSLVTPEIGAGPFQVVVEGGWPEAVSGSPEAAVLQQRPKPLRVRRSPFTHTLTTESPVSIQPSALQIGPVLVDMSKAVLWQPRVDWAQLQANTVVWQPHIPQIQAMMVQRWAQIGRETAVMQQKLEYGMSLLLQGISHYDAAVVCQGAQQLAGLGRGLTPAGDDVLIGAIYGLWATLPEMEARPLVEMMVATAVPQTTTLSAAWLRAAGQGEAGVAWHLFGEQLAVSSEQYSVNGNRWEEAVARILAVGHSSGVEALWGFTAVVCALR